MTVVYFNVRVQEEGLNMVVLRTELDKDSPVTRNYEQVVPSEADRDEV